MPLATLPCHWELIGQEGVKIMLGKKSGRPRIEYKFKERGNDIPENKKDEILLDINETTIKTKRMLTDDEFKEIVKRHPPVVSKHSFSKGNLTVRLRRVEFSLSRKV